MPLEYLIPIAFFLDLLLGDPSWLPHPVRFIGNLVVFSEKLTRRLVTNNYAAGLLAVLIVLFSTGIVTYGFYKGAALVHPWLGELTKIYLLYTALATRDLAVHSWSVGEALGQNDLELARKRVGMIVGRETSELDEEGVTRACVESVAENIVDGITAPLFWAVIAGPLGALLYKAVNTMDSMYGYKNEKYIQFGWCAAKLDDIANYLPARITAWLVIGVAALLKQNPAGALKIWCRDRRCHASPNSGQTEAAVAGALGIRFGGPSNYFGKVVEKPFIGDADNIIAVHHIKIVNKLMLATSTIAMLIFCLLRHLLYS